MNTNNPVTAIIDWFKKAKPQPSIKNIFTQLGCHFEEISEMLDTIPECEVMADEMNTAAINLKTADIDVYGEQMENTISAIDKVELLDSLCDQIVTALGVGYDLGFDMEGALWEVIKSNYSKFDDDGNPIFDENMKITKGNNYFKPNLEKYI
ncbi:hypothetical protein C0208_01475 [Moraxella catarrhalis]|uniref:nucleoside triphosphate pyrophosphohydrolase family protein n=1 Tax=Moraxella catarrhalis TaxID=480 RepID=UPI00128BCC37|nr:nucleoside triphosphate pyrophosphohydrolase family protein [Moraxella catarrhalis]MPW63497.1 hypothetical protein [Moraxella catarrhalis]